MRFILRPVTWRKMRSIGVSVRCLRGNTLQPFPEVMRRPLSAATFKRSGVIRMEASLEKVATIFLYSSA